MAYVKNLKLIHVALGDLVAFLIYKCCLLTWAFIIRIRRGTNQPIYQAGNWTILIMALKMWKCSCFLNIPYCSPCSLLTKQYFL